MADSPGPCLSGVAEIRAARSKSALLIRQRRPKGGLDERRPRAIAQYLSIARSASQAWSLFVLALAKTTNSDQPRGGDYDGRHRVRGAPHAPSPPCPACLGCPGFLGGPRFRVSRARGPRGHVRSSGPASHAGGQSGQAARGSRARGQPGASPYRLGLFLSSHRQKRPIVVGNDVRRRRSSTIAAHRGGSRTPPGGLVGPPDSLADS
jgi:hypothetical protein